jgi:CelD/BcsL family acetyltransferase involved in cellulose biosynthesis
VLAFAGGGVSDYLNVLLQPSCGPEMLSRILSAVEGIENWTFLELTDLQGKSNLLSVAGLSAHVYQHDTCSVTLLPDSSEALLREFSDRQRANLRLARSRLQRAGGGEVQIATQETMSQFLDELFALHAIRWSSAGEAGVLCDPRVQRFHRVSAPLLLARGYLRLYRLRVGDRTAAVVYSLFDRTTVFCYLQGFDPQFSFLSPGTLLMFSVMEDVIRLGGHRFDFLRGREGYKQHWRPQVEHTFRITFPRSALCSLPGDSAKAA